MIFHVVTFVFLYVIFTNRTRNYFVLIVLKPLMFPVFDMLFVPFCICFLSFCYFLFVSFLVSFSLALQILHVLSPASNFSTLGCP